MALQDATPLSTVIRHVIYYRETDYGIEVIRVLHDRMLATRYLQAETRDGLGTANRS